MNRVINVMVVNPLAALGRKAGWLAEIIGGITILCYRIFVAMIPPRFDRREMWRNLYKVGVKSCPVVILTALFAGAIMVIQSGPFIEKTGATSFLGWGAGLAVFSEIGPVLIGLMFSGRVGANNTAELGTMVVTDQVAALRALSIDPVKYLIVPRFVSMMLMLGLLTVLGDVFAMVGGAMASQAILHVDWRVFLDGVIEGDLLNEFLIGILKAVCFGFTIAVISCYYGLSVRGGATGVGRAVNNSVVASAIGIFVTDYAITVLAVGKGWM
jgi:phospholipid/cholesterol/gamma-HCH transport system permease protein